jgi:hypothetical protein
MRPRATAHAHKRHRRKPPTTQQLDDAISYRLGHSPLGLAGADYGATQHIQIAPEAAPE